MQWRVVLRLREDLLGREESCPDDPLAWEASWWKVAQKMPQGVVSICDNTTWVLSYSCHLSAAQGEGQSLKELKALPLHRVRESEAHGHDL